MERQDLKGARIHVRGIVQGVGFRPFVYALAQRLALNGWVRNTSAGVDIELDGAQPVLDAFVQALKNEAPDLARIDAVEVAFRQPDGFTGFEIIESQAVDGAFQPISPDVCICSDCLRELFDPADRRYRYPFINCTNCGPRFTIIQDIPYDRPNTTMAGFALCPRCAAEYHDPLDRRFHAQPVACPQCGPQVWLETNPVAGTSGPVAGIADPGAVTGEDAIQAARRMLRDGRILAIKGLGGFHLACDATNLEAVAELRRRKLRVDKPFALMAPDIASIEAICWLSPLETGLLERRERPIVILRRKDGSPVAQEVAPGQNTLGVMLPYTPLHYLLFAAPEQAPGEPLRFDLPVLVMTSGNLSEEPICTANDEARRRLAPLADAFLMHDRDIHTRCDDSVVRLFPNTLAELTRGTASGKAGGKRSPLYPLRRARGYAPEPLPLPLDAPPLLAAGAELKNTFCLARERYAFLSHHIGDLENYETLQAFESGVRHYERLFRLRPEGIAYDLHPNYLATRYAQERICEEDLPAIGVQHHHAHIAACMADNGLSGETPVIGVAFDGAGFGDDEAVWGGEFLIADYKTYERPFHLAYTPLPGGDKAVREPWRMALSWLHTAGIDWDAGLPPVQHAMSLPQAVRPLDALRRQLETGVNAPQTSSMGRLFDAVAALAGVRPLVNYEAQAAIELEALASGREPGYYPFELGAGLLDPAPALRAVIEDLRRGVGLPVIAARFHAGVARATLDVCLELRRQYKINDVALSGGVWQNSFLLALAAGLLQQERFSVYLHRQTPANDGGLALGQAVIAAAKL